VVRAVVGTRKAAQRATVVVRVTLLGHALPGTHGVERATFRQVVPWHRPIRALIDSKRFDQRWLPSPSTGRAVAACSGLSVLWGTDGHLAMGGHPVVGVLCEDIDDQAENRIPTGEDPDGITVASDLPIPLRAYGSFDRIRRHTDPVNACLAAACAPHLGPSWKARVAVGTGGLVGLGPSAIPGVGLGPEAVVRAGAVVVPDVLVGDVVAGAPRHRSRRRRRAELRVRI